VNGALWLVRDLALGTSEHDLEIRWHFAHDCTAREASAGEILITQKDSREPALRIFTPEGTTWKTQVTSGTISPAYGCYQSAPEIRYGARTKLPAEIATVFLTGAHALRKLDEVRMGGTQNSAVQVYELHSEGGQDLAFFFSREGRPWSFGPWSSDAEFLYCQFEHEKITHLIAIHGSSVTRQGHSLLATCDSFQYLEWRKQGGVTHAEPVSVAPNSLLDELAGVTSSSRSSSASYAEKR